MLEWTREVYNTVFNIEVNFIFRDYCYLNAKEMYFLCGKLCDETRGCTHFTFLDQECHLKRGEVSLNDAVNVSKDAKDDMMKCGFPNKVCPNIKCKVSELRF